MIHQEPLVVSLPMPVHCAKGLGSLRDLIGRAARLRELHGIAQIEPLERDMAFRIVGGIVVLLGAMVPVMATSLALAICELPLEQPSSAVATPNPSKAPWYFLSPTEMLVCYDPFFAGTIHYWIGPWAVILCGFTVVTMVLVSRGRPGIRLPTWNRISTYVVGSAILGVLFAVPWLYVWWIR